MALQDYHDYNFLRYNFQNYIFEEKNWKEFSEDKINMNNLIERKIWEKMQRYTGFALTSQLQKLIINDLNNALKDILQDFDFRYNNIRYMFEFTYKEKKTKKTKKIGKQGD